MTVFLRRLGAHLLTVLRREPVTTWGVALSVLLGVLSGVSGLQGAVTAAFTLLPLLGIPVVRGRVSPLDALRGVLDGADGKLDGRTDVAGLFRELLPEVVVPGMRLGRHVAHDPRSLGYAYVADDRPLVSHRWSRRCPVLDQGNVGACTGNALVGWLGTDTLAREGSATVDETLALGVYHDETLVDGFPGTYPPDDTGSDGLAAGKVAVQRTWATGYRHAFDVLDALHAIVYVGPVLLGMAWRTGCDRPTVAGRIRWTGAVRGGHELLADELHVVLKRDGTLDETRSLVGITNSWSTAWGQAGRCYLPVADLRRALAQQGDATILDAVPAPVPAPPPVAKVRRAPRRTPAARRA